MARQFARLKLRLIRNGLRTPQYRIFFALGAGGAAFLALLGFVTLASLRGEPDAGDVTIVVFAAITVVWTIVPLLGFGTDETLDPQRLALLPLRRSQLLHGLLVAAIVGVAPVATLFALTGAVVGLAHGVLSVFLIAIAVVATLVLCVVASRVLIALLAPLLRSRRGRDLIVMAVTLGVFLPQALRLFRADGRGNDTREAFAHVAQRVRFTPFGWTGYAATEAGAGHIATAVLVLAVVGTLIGVLLWAWSKLIPRAMTASDIAARADRHGKPAPRSSLFPRATPVAWRNRTGAIAAKELRYYIRDPRRRAPVFAALIIPGLVLLQTLRNAQTRPASSTLLGLVALLPASGLTLNQFGLDGAALWSAIVAGNDGRADLTGKNVATGVIVAPLILVPTLITAAITGGWAYVPLTLGLAPGMLAVVLAIGNLVSVWAPYALPDRRNPLAANPGQGCLGFVAAIGALAVDALILVPVGVVTAVSLHAFSLPLATLVSVVCATIWGASVWLAARATATRRLWWHMPELLDAVSPRHAG